MSFAGDVIDFAKKANLATEDVIKATAVELFSSIIDDTPVDTGRARGNWQATNNTPAISIIDRFGSEGATKDVVDEVNKLRGDGVVYLSNNLPYISKIEYDGHSSEKAPEGMVRKNVARVQQNLRKNVRKYKV